MVRISFYILIAALLLMAVLMVAIPLPQKDKRLRGYMFSRWMLTLSYLALGVYCYFKGRMQLEVVSPLFLFMSNLQAVLLALSHINLIHPQRVTTRYVLWHFVPQAICLLAYAIVRCCSPHVALTSYAAIVENITQPEVIVRLVWFVQYVVICFYFISLFVLESRRWSELASDFFADQHMISIRLIHASLLSVIAIGITTLAITTNLRPMLAVGLNATILVLYIIMGCLFLRYPALFVRMRPVLYEPIAAPEKKSTIRWSTMRKQIIDARMYLQPSVTLEQIAHDLGCSRTMLSNTINSEEGMNFNAFINRLRVLEAQRLMREKPQLSLHDVAVRVGYTEQSNFSNQFKHWSGRSPQEWKDIRLTASSNTHDNN